jgi:hypothetical protein
MFSDSVVCTHPSLLACIDFACSTILNLSWKEPKTKQRLTLSTFTPACKPEVEHTACRLSAENWEKALRMDGPGIYLPTLRRVSLCNSSLLGALWK